EHFGYIVAEVFFGEHTVTLGVDFGALRVEHVVVFEEVLTHIKVGAFNPGLGLLDNTPDQPHFEGQGIIDLHALHQRIGLGAAKEAHQLVSHGEVKARRARVTLAGSAAAKLVVDTPGFMAFGANHMQTAQFADLFHVFHVFQEVLDLGFVDAVIFRVHGKDGLPALLHGHFKRIFGGIGASNNPVDCGQDLLGQLTTQLNVHTAASHVGGNGDCAKSAGAGNDLTLFGVVLGVKHVVRDPTLQDSF